MGYLIALKRLDRCVKFRFRQLLTSVKNIHQSGSAFRHILKLHVGRSLRLQRLTGGGAVSRSRVPELVVFASEIAALRRLSGSGGKSVALLSALS